MHSETSRRALIGAMVGLPIVAAVAAIPAPAAATVTSNWRSAVYAMQKANEARDLYETTVFDPVREAWAAQIEAIPHIGSEFVDVAGNSYPMSTQDEWTVKMARRELHHKRNWHPDDYDYRDYCQKIVDGAAWREAERRRIDKESGFSEIFDKSDEFGEAAYNALDAAILTPVANLAELREKVELLAEHDGFGTPDWADALLADIRRIAGEA